MYEPSAPVRRCVRRPVARLGARRRGAGRPGHRSSQRSQPHRARPFADRRIGPRSPPATTGQPATSSQAPVSPTPSRNGFDRSPRTASPPPTRPGSTAARSPPVTVLTTAGLTTAGGSQPCRATSQDRERRRAASVGRTERWGDADFELSLACRSAKIGREAGIFASSALFEHCPGVGDPGAATGLSRADLVARRSRPSECAGDPDHAERPDHSVR